MKVSFTVKLLRMNSGERFPLLVDGDGVPLFEPTVYSLTCLRARNQATNTISSHLRAIQIFYLFLHVQKIDLFSRVRSGQVLSMGEVEYLTRLCRIPVSKINVILHEPTQLKMQSKVVSFERVRVRLKEGGLDEVDPTFAGTRMRYIQNYIEWMVSMLLSEVDMKERESNGLPASLKQVLTSISARIPKGGGGKSREGLDGKAVDQIWKLVSVQSAVNPWKREHVRFRNALIIHCLYYLGLRRGELLGIRVSDVNFRDNTITIHRRADDSKDPRKNQPQTKTRARVLPIGGELRAMVYDYVMEYRIFLIGAKKHDFLLCSDKTGDPMSISAFNKVFNVLVEASPKILEGLCPHVLRHTWNDRFSEEMDQRKVSEESEKKMRSFLMGWSETSGTAATYTRRHVRKKAQEVSLEMQKKMTGEES